MSPFQGKREDLWMWVNLGVSRLRDGHEFVGWSREGIMGVGGENDFSQESA
jgi:hypothetical protein